MPQFAHLYNGDDIWVVMKVKRVSTHRAFKDHQPVPGVSVGNLPLTPDLHAPQGCRSPAGNRPPYTAVSWLLQLSRAHPPQAAYQTTSPILPGLLSR